VAAIAKFLFASFEIGNPTNLSFLCQSVVGTPRVAESPFGISSVLAFFLVTVGFGHPCGGCPSSIANFFTWELTAL